MAKRNDYLLDPFFYNTFISITIYYYVIYLLTFFCAIIVVMQKM